MSSVLVPRPCLPCLSGRRLGLLLAALSAGCGGSTDLGPEDAAVRASDLSGLSTLRDDGGPGEADLGCATACGGAERCCRGRCVDLRSDPAHCGGCGAACQPGWACCQSTCVQAASDPANCGRCGAACSYPNAAGLCQSGACSMGACSPGFGDCNHDPVDGCELNLRIDLANCGACGHRCSFPHGLAGCARGCYLAACQFGFDDCNGDPADGCETSILEDVRNCGGCGQACQPLAHAKIRCSAGGCGIAACDSGWLDCDQLPGNGCEVNAFADARNCGACGAACAMGLVCRSGQCTCPQCNFPNARSSCRNNRCQLDSCLPGFADCDGNPQNGCEVVTDSDPKNCGACGMACKDGSLCVSGVCSFNLISNASWKQTLNAGIGWQNPGFDDSKWDSAVEEGDNGSAPWGHLKAFDDLASSAKWIWYYDSRNGDDTSTVYFRRTFTATAAKATITMTVDNTYVLYVDGQQIGSNDDWTVVHTWPLQLVPNRDYVVAIQAVNQGGPGGVIFDLR